jgi:hypothetical protein
MKRYLIQKSINGVYRNYVSFDNINDALLTGKLIHGKYRIYDRVKQIYIKRGEN